MCGRFTLRTPNNILVEQFLFDKTEELEPRFNVAPTQQVLCVRQKKDQTGREAAMMKWGLIPFWAKEASIGNRMINARSETAADKPAFRSAIRRRRCLIIADGYYEWRKTGGKQKQPYLFHFADDRPFAFAGLWEKWGKDDPLLSCTILTTTANNLTAPIHDRMPVILDETTYDQWLDRTCDDPVALSPLWQTREIDELTADPVSTHVNNARHDDPQCVSVL